jgi:hypothetical protein
MLVIFRANWIDNRAQTFLVGSPISESVADINSAVSPRTREAPTLCVRRIINRDVRG